MRRVRGASEASIASNALLHCGILAIPHQMNWVLIIPKAAHSSSQRSLSSDWQHSSSQLSVRIKSPMHLLPRRALFFSGLSFSQTFVKLTPPLTSDYLDARGKRMSVAWRDDA